ncbi:MAG: response regulator [Nitrospiraceae bacterium]|nr:MAG: response regulator [Nitrospiraceae bacterium]
MDKSEFRMLVADDDVMVRDVIVKFLSGQGYSVITANDGLEALQLLRLEDIHLVLTDLRMPGADGMEILRTAVRINPKIAVVVITAYGTLDTALEAVNEGAFDYVAKPFVMQQLLLVVRNAYRMTLLSRENERLLSQLKEAYRSRDGKKPDEYGKGSVMPIDSHERIEKLRELNLINSEEAHVLQERLKSGDGNIKKYNSLVQGLKKQY